MEKSIVKLSNLRKIEEFNVEEGENLIVSDPCYDLKNVNKINGLNHRLKAKPGTWVYDFNEDTMTLDVYESRSSFLVIREGINSDIFDEIRDFAVDSGQVGVFLENSYQKDSLVKNIEFENEFFNDMKEQWYRACCEVTCSNDKIGFVPDGFVTSTKYGDGVYPVGIKYAPGTDEVAYLRIITEDICEHCGKESCDCEFCDECGYEISECCCEYCDECGELIEYCTCDEEDEFDDEEYEFDDEEYDDEDGFGDEE